MKNEGGRFQGTTRNFVFDAAALRQDSSSRTNGWQTASSTDTQCCLAELRAICRHMLLQSCSRSLVDLSEVVNAVPMLAFFVKGSTLIRCCAVRRGSNAAGSELSGSHVESCSLSHVFSKVLFSRSRSESLVAWKKQDTVGYTPSIFLKPEMEDLFQVSTFLL